MAYVSAAEFRSAFLVALRAWTVEPLAGAVFRKGPLRSVRLAGTEPALVIMSWQGLPGGEQSMGSGNNWRHEEEFELLLAVPDDEDDPETSDDTLLALWEEFKDFMQANRSIAGTRVCRIKAAPVFIGQLFENTAQVFRMIPCAISYQTAKGG